jgi:signal transduction histidine kinase
VRHLLDVLQTVQFVVLVVLGVVAVRMAIIRRDAAHRWLAATFGLLALIALAGRFIPKTPDVRWVQIVTRVLIAVLALFPYFLYRFMATFMRPRRWIYQAAAVSTAALVLWALLLPRIPAPGERRAPVFTAFVVVFLAHWTALSTLVAVRLWRAGRRQPPVARRRMQTLALGAVGVALALLASGTSSSSETDEVRPSEIVSQALVLLSAPLFLLGFAPPATVLAFWRRREEADLRAAEMGLMQALSAADVAASLLPKVTTLVGGRGAAILGHDGSVIGVHSMTEDEVTAASEQSLTQPHLDAAIADGERLWVPIGPGWLVVLVTPFTPFFGREESRSLLALGVLTDLALSRADLYERERNNVETMRDFVAIASHDLRTPTAVITGYASMLTNKWAALSDDQKHQMVATISRQGVHLARLIEDLLTISQIEAAVIPTAPEELDLRERLAQLLHDLGAVGGEVPCDVPAGLRVYADPEHLRRIVTNYVRNAGIYGAPPVSLTARRVDGGVEIAVADSGPGVPPEFAPRLFEKFARADKKMSKATEGTGLGLSIVRGLARAAGGDAWYAPNEPTGSIFSVRLPARAAESAMAPDPAEAP